jgi:hypothetical protein
MRTHAAVLLAMIAAACGGSRPRQPLYAAGSERDEGHGQLAQASAKLMTDEETEPRLAPGGSSGAKGGKADGDGAYGGTTYGRYVPPAWSYPTVNRTPTYNQKPGLRGAIEGRITWRGAPAKLTTACGPIEPVRLGAQRAVSGALVYIERVSVGRVLPHASGEQRPATVGGVIVKRGCAFAPSVQLVTPVPAALAIHGDARRTRIRITGPDGVTSTADLHEAGRVPLQLGRGITRIDAEDGSIGAAWVVGLDTPYYALTDDAGRFRIDELAPGSYEVSIWQPAVPTVRDGVLVYGAPVIVKRTVQVGGDRAARLDVTLGH